MNIAIQNGYIYVDGVNVGTVAQATVVPTPTEEELNNLRELYNAYQEADARYQDTLASLALAQDAYQNAVEILGRATDAYCDCLPKLQQKYPDYDFSAYNALAQAPAVEEVPVIDFREMDTDALWAMLTDPSVNNEDREAIMDVIISR